MHEAKPAHHAPEALPGVSQVPLRFLQNAIIVAEQQMFNRLTFSGLLHAIIVYSVYCLLYIVCYILYYIYSVFIICY